MKTKKKALSLVAALAVLLLAAVIIIDALGSRSSESNFFAMNTAVSLSLEGFDAEQTAALITERTNELDTKELSRTAAGSEIYALNAASGDGLELSEQLAALLGSLKQLEEDSHGAFCISLGALSDLWNIGDGGGYLPGQDEISAALETKNNWRLNGNTAAVERGTIIDLGAVGKGAACDEAEKILESSRCKRAVIAVGGSVMLWSKKDESFNVGIRNPLGEANEYAAVIETGGCFISTSGNYERFFTGADGKTYHHIFDPSTGFPAESGLLSVTVLCNSGAMSDALSTACFVLGLEKSLPLLEKYNAQAVFITEEKEIITTPGFSARLRITNDDFTAGAEI